MRLSIAFSIDSVTFTKDVIEGKTSLGGSESAAVGLARALSARHDVHIFTTKLGEDAPQIDAQGVTWHDMARTAQWSMFKDWDVAIALRQPDYLQALPAKFRILWCQDLMSTEAMKNHVMSLAWAYDAIAYVSEYHRKQWEGWLPELQPIGWATKNGHEAGLAKSARDSAIKNPNQIIHISRPERGLQPILEMWPALRKANPQAELKLCRYSSMYDATGWGKVCQAFDADVQAINDAVGGITYLGELNKGQLYNAIAESAVMWYPGISTFAETSCIAAIEAQACGTPLVASYKGALPETCPSGVFVTGQAEGNPEYQAQSIAAVLQMLDGCQKNSFSYRQRIKDGIRHVEGYSYPAIAAEWEAFLLQSFKARYESNKLGILRRLDHDDDLTTAKIVAAELGNEGEAVEVTALANRVSRGLEHTADHYFAFALKTRFEVDRQIPRHLNVVKQFEGCKNLLDIACGNGAFAIMLAQADPERHVTAIDFSPENIAQAKDAAESYGVSAQIDFVSAAAWDMDAQAPSDWLASQPSGTYDGVFCGEFIEHVANCEALVNEVGRVSSHMARIVFSCPFGPLGRLASRHDVEYRSHVHHFRAADLDAIFGQKDAYLRLVMPWPSITGRGEPVGNWVISYRNDGPTGVKPVERRILLRPYRLLTAGIITNDTTDLRRCLEHIWPVADEILIGDCGARQADLDAILVEFPKKTRVITVGQVTDLPGGFSEARNTVLAAAKGDWFLWIDSDETLCGQLDVAKYLDGPVFNGYIVPQNHLYMDGPMGTDLPVRLFRKRADIQFYGCVHEQPQMGDCNGDIAPLLQLSDVQIAHTGYLHESIRRDKALNRNLPLLIRDMDMFPDRVLGKLLVLRDHANLALWDRQRYRGELTEKARFHYGQVVAYFEEHFLDPSNKFHKLARPFYEQAIQFVNGAMEIEVAVAGGFAPDGLNGNRAKPERIWARTVPHLKTLLQHRLDVMFKQLEPNVVLDVEPLTPARQFDPVCDEPVEAKTFAVAHV